MSDFTQMLSVYNDETKAVLNKIRDELNADNVFSKLEADYNVYDLLTFNEFNIQDRLERISFHMKDFRLKFLQEQAKLSQVEDHLAKVTADKYIALKEGSVTLTKTEIEQFRLLLIDKWAELLGDVSSIESEALRKSRADATGDLSSMPIHMADIGTDNYEQEFSLNLLDSERKLLKEINDALDRTVNKVYGVCEGTDNWISRQRLEAKPWARYCIEYAQMIESDFIDKVDQLSEGLFIFTGKSHHHGCTQRRLGHFSPDIFKYTKQRILFVFTPHAP